MGDIIERLGPAPADLQKPKGWGCRHTLAFLGFLGFTLLYGMRVSMSIAIVAMVHHDHENNVTLISAGAGDTPNSSEASGSGSGVDFVNLGGGQREVNWDSKSQGLILGAIYWGSLVSKLPGGLVAQRFGGKWPLGLAMMGVSVMTLLIPLVASFSWHLLLLARAFQGLCDGFCSPAMHTLLAQWAPPNERSKLATFIYAGGQLGTAIMMVSSGYLIEADILGGWPSPFYVTGSIGIIWSLCWMLISSESPGSSTRISSAEMIYIHQSIGDRVSKKGNTLNVPWKAIFTSLPVWAIIIANTADAWGFYTFLTELPTYMKTVLKFNIKANSWLSALPYLISWGFSIALTQLADYFISYKKVKIVIVRKACETIGHLGSAVCLVAASYVGYSRALTVALVTIGISINGATYGGYAVNHVDIAPNHAGVLLGFTSTIANVCGIAAPYVVGLLTSDNPSLDNWQLVFFIAAAIYVFDTIFYLLFAAGEEQDWNDERSKDELKRKQQTATLLKT